MPGLTDAEILANYQKANPYISMAVAKELHRIEHKFGHLGRLKMQKERQAQEQNHQKLEQLLMESEGASTAPLTSRSEDK